MWHYLENVYNVLYRYKQNSHWKFLLYNLIYHISDGAAAEPSSLIPLHENPPYLDDVDSHTFRGHVCAERSLRERHGENTFDRNDSGYRGKQEERSCWQSGNCTLYFAAKVLNLNYVYYFAISVTLSIFKIGKKSQSF